MTQSPAVVKVTVPEAVTLQALPSPAENVTAPPRALACTVYGAPLYVGLLGVEVKTMFCEAWPTANGITRCGAALYCELPAWFAAIVQVPTPVKSNVLPAPRTHTVGERLLYTTGLPDPPPEAETV